MAESSEPYAVLIGEILLQRTRAEHAPDTYHRFLSLWPTPEALSTAPTERIEEVIAPLGLRKRAALLRELGSQLTRLGRVPLRPEALMALPGVGPYTAHAVPILARNRNLPLVDWVIARVLRRYFGIGGTRRPNADRDLWALADTVVESGRAREVWLGTLDLAAAVCKERPLCGECPLSATCKFTQAKPPQHAERLGRASPPPTAQSPPRTAPERHCRFDARPRSLSHSTRSPLGKSGGARPRGD